MRKLLVLLTTVVAVQALSGLTAASAPPDVATGTWAISVLPGAELVPQGQRCLLTHFVAVVTYTGTLDGATTTVGGDALWLATCDEVVASGFRGIPLVYQVVEHFVSADGKSEATFRSAGRVDAAGVYQGTSSLVGDLQGNIHITGTTAAGGGTYEGRVRGR
jgi:hypothetical protein